MPSSLTLDVCHTKFFVVDEDDVDLEYELKFLVQFSSLCGLLLFLYQGNQLTCTDYGQQLCPGWQRGCFINQRSLVRIHPSAKFCTELVTVEKTGK